MRKIRSSRGFTLVELMVAVAVLAILSVIATVSYSKYIRKARTTEAITFLADIKMKQETYHQTYGMYVKTSSADNAISDADFYPKTKNSDGYYKWEMKCPEDKGSYPGWCALGSRPTAEEGNYQYVTVGWQPQDPPVAAPDGKYIKDGTRRWWFAEARGDLDENNVYSTFRLSSELTQVVFWNENE